MTKETHVDFEPIRDKMSAMLKSISDTKPHVSGLDAAALASSCHDAATPHLISVCATVLQPAASGVLQEMGEAAIKLVNEVIPTFGESDARNIAELAKISPATTHV